MRGECEVRVITKTIYSYEDMKALDDMTHEEAADYLRSAYSYQYARRAYEGQ